MQYIYAAHTYLHSVKCIYHSLHRLGNVTRVERSKTTGKLLTQSTVTILHIYWKPSSQLQQQHHKWHNNYQTV